MYELESVRRVHQTWMKSGSGTLESRFQREQEEMSDGLLLGYSFLGKGT
jgi:hypothetical protein